MTIKKLSQFFIIFLSILCLDTLGIPQIVETSQGNVEFIGLEKWTPEKIQKELGYDSPDKLYYCAQDLKNKLKFPDAAVFRYMKENGFTTIVVIEPQNAHLVRYRSLPSGTVKITDDWQNLVEMVQREDHWKNPDVWQKVIRQRNSEKDFALAKQILLEDKDTEKRIAATHILGNFADRDPAWYLLMDGLRDPEARIYSASMQVLSELIKKPQTFKINWSPMTETIRHLLNGTNPFATPVTIQTLLKTEVSPKLAGALIGNKNGKILLAYLKAQHGFERGLAHQLLIKLAQRDYGFNLKKWEDWITQLNKNLSETGSIANDYLLNKPLCEDKTQVPKESKSLIIKNVTVIDGTSAELRSKMTIVIKGNLITDVVSTKNLKIPKGAKVINAKGKYAIPGLWDMHIHLKNSTASALPVFIANGVTSVRDMVGDFDELTELRRKVEAGEIVGPRIKFSGPALESPENIANAKEKGKKEDFDKTRIPVAKPEDAAPAIKKLKEMGVDFVKIHSWASEEVYFAIAKAAKEENIQLVGHSPESFDPIKVANAGQTGFEHGFFPYPLSKYSEAEQNKIIEAFIENKAAFVPTLVAWTERLVPLEKAKAIVADDANKIDYRRKYTSPELIEYWGVQLEPRKPLSEKGLEGWTNAIDSMAKDIGIMHRKGVRVTPGTDLAVPLVFPGFSLHDELKMFVTKIGMTPMQAIESATKTPAEFMGMQNCLGTIEKGKIADIVLLDANPLDNINNIRKVNSVIVQGKYITPKMRQEILQNIERKVNQEAKSPGKKTVSQDTLQVADKSFSQKQAMVGHWEGAYVRLGAVQTVSMDFWLEDDTLKGTYEIPDLSIYDEPITNLSYNFPNLEFKPKYGVFQMVINSEYSEITGENKKWNPTVTLHLKRKLKEPPNFQKEAVKFKNGEVTLAGRLYKPLAEGNYPAVVVVHGSGEQGLDTNYYNFWGRFFASRGIVALLYDKRGVGKSDGDYKKSGFDDLAGDAVVAINFLKARKEVNREKIGLFGISQGGCIAPLAATKSKDVKFLILDVGPAVTVEEQELNRVEYSLRADEFSETDIAEALNYTRLMFKTAYTGEGWSAIEKFGQKIKDKKWAEYVSIADSEKDLEGWKRIRFDPAPVLKKTKIPVLALFGEKDVLVPPKENRDKMEQYLKEAGNKDFTIEVIPNVGHDMESFATLYGGDWNWSANYWVWAKKSPLFYETIIDWLSKR